MNVQAPGVNTAGAAESIRAALKPFGNVPFVLRVRAAQGSTTLRQALALDVGSLLPLESTPRDMVDLVCGDVLIARGEIISIDGRLLLRVTEVVA